MNKAMALFIVVLIGASAGPALAQPGPGAGRRMGPGGGMGPRFYNPQTVTTIKGQVESLETLSGMGRRGGRGMMHRRVVLKTDQGRIIVHLGPTWYVTEEKLPLKVGATLEVTGSKVTRNGKTVIVAREAKTDGKTLTLRDEQGLPVWRGMGRGGGRGRQ
jgi:hypothetical protein